MTKSIFEVLYIVVMIGVIVSADLLFFKHRFWERLLMNIGNCLGVLSLLFEIPKEPVR